MKPIKRAVLVYQAGIANVFAVESFRLTPADRGAHRLYQGDFRTAESFARGLGAAGVIVRSAACNMAGDVAGTEWTQDLDSAPFSDRFRPVYTNG